MKTSTLKCFGLAVVLLAAIPNMTQANILNSPFGVYNVIVKTFQAVSNGVQTRVNWEIEPLEYEVIGYLERSSDGVTFEIIYDFTVAKGEGASLHFTDLNLEPGLYYYRIHCERTGYRPFISPLVAVKVPLVSANQNEFRVVNPFSGAIRIQGHFSGQPLRIELTDMMGRVKMQQVINPGSHAQSITIQTSGIGKGMYVLRVKEMDEATARLVMARWVYSQGAQ